MQDRPDASGDYEYDLVHEQPGRGEKSASHRADAPPAPAPAGRPLEDGEDMSYDEAHDF